MIIEFNEAELTALHKFFERGLVGQLSPMEVVQICTRGQLLVQSYAAKSGFKLSLEESGHAHNNS